MLQMSFNQLILQHSDPAAMMFQVNSLDSKNAELTQFEILQFTAPFIEMLPKIEFEDEARKRAISITSLESVLSQKLAIDSEEYSSMQRPRGEGQIHDKQVVGKLQAKIFSPHLISNNTVLNFQAFKDDGNLVSIIDILRIFNEGNKHHAKFYFKFSPDEIDGCRHSNKLETESEMQKIRNLDGA